MEKVKITRKDGVEYYRTPKQKKIKNKCYCLRLREEKFDELSKHGKPSKIIKTLIDEYLKIMEKGKDNNLNRFLDYKSRIDKAIEYIEGWQSFPHTNGSTHNELKNLKNILTGGDE